MDRQLVMHEKTDSSAWWQIVKRSSIHHLKMDQVNGYGYNADMLMCEAAALSNFSPPEGADYFYGYKWLQCGAK